MKKMKKFFAILLAMTMIMGMSATVSAATTEGYGKYTLPAGQEPSVNDEVDVKIEGITKEGSAAAGTVVNDKVTVTLYQIAKANYATTGGQNGILNYTWAAGAEPKDEKMPTAAEIAQIANKLSKNPKEITPFDTKVKENVEGTYTEKVGAGAYIAIITGSQFGYVYNPVLLTATYNATTDAQGNVTEVNLMGGTIDVSSANYMYGTTALAKRTEPGVDKSITKGTEKETVPTGTVIENSFEEGGTTKIHTATVGDVIDFAITPTMPSYPADAVNKTVIISDTLPVGMTFDTTSLKVTVNGTEYPGTPDNTTAPTKYTFAMGTETFATATLTKSAAVGTDGAYDGFYISFVYNKLLVGENATAENYVYAPTVSYKATVNAAAEAGKPGNTNKATFIYSNTPNIGSTHDTPPTNPQEETAWGLDHKEDEETVYTYQLAFMKTDDATTNAKPLAGAVFGIYKEQACTTLVDTVMTNEHGYAVSTNIEAGTYYLKELIAPTGYQLSDTVTPIPANWTSATKTVTKTEVQDRKYTTVQANGVAQVGWIKNGVFYEMNHWTTEEAATAGAKAAYPAAGSNDTTSTTLTTVTTMNTGSAGAGTVLGSTITNTKLVALPSTGGIGTTIFTIGGCAIMILAAGLYFASRRKSAK